MAADGHSLGFLRQPDALLGAHVRVGRVKQADALRPQRLDRVRRRVRLSSRFVEEVQAHSGRRYGVLHLRRGQCRGVL